MKVITHPKPAVPTHCKTPLGAADKLKRALYSASYPGVMHQIRPIVMDTFGGFAKDSLGGALKACSHRRHDRR
jgi:hypothetical protein